MIVQKLNREERKETISKTEGKNVTGIEEEGRNIKLKKKMFSMRKVCNIDLNNPEIQR